MINKKQVIGVIAFLSIMLFAVLASAVLEGEEEKVNQGYLCLENKVNESTCNLLTLEQKLFSFLTIGKCLNESLNDASANLTCWSNGACDIKKTGQAVFALTNAKESDLTNAINWLKGKNTTATNLVWLLEIESSEAVVCTATVNSVSTDITISKNKVVTSVSNSGCFSAWGQSQGYGNNYWVKVAPSCYNKEITIKCDQSALTALLYKKDESFSTPIYVSNNPQQCESGQTCTQEITSYCFSTSGSCDGAYEQSLWAALALKINGEDISAYLPYLITMSDDSANEKYLPYSFLYIITNSIEYQTKLLEMQLSEGSWGDVFQGKYYGTALAMLPYVGQADFEEKTLAKKWLLKSQDSAGTNKGCWNSGSIRDTAFILYSLWGDFEFHGTDDDCTVDADCPAGEVCVNEKCILDTDECTDDTECSYGESCIDSVCIESANGCEDNNGYCISVSACDEALGSKLGFNDCLVPNMCCSKPELVKTCAQLGGNVCLSGETCLGTTLTEAVESRCCSDNCKPAGDTSAYDCKLNGGKCSITGDCESGYEPTSTYKCSPSVDQCCMKKTTPDKKSYWWIWVLVILIAIIAVAIIFKDKLKEMWLRMKMKKSGPSGRPGLPPRPMPPSRPGPPRGDVNDVLKKLKEMGR